MSGFGVELSIVQIPDGIRIYVIVLILGHIDYKYEGLVMPSPVSRYLQIKNACSSWDLSSFFVWLEQWSWGNASSLDAQKC